MTGTQSRSEKASIESLTKPVYSTQNLKSYDQERHIPLNESFELLKRTPHLNTEDLNSAIQNGQIRTYDFEGQRYLDRLDIGRVYHIPQEKQGLTIERYFTRDLAQEGVNPLSSVDYEKRTIIMKDVDGKVIFEMEDTEFPKDWDDVSAKIVTEKYFFKPSKPEWKEKIKRKTGREHEYSPAHLINRVTNFIADKGAELGYFATEEDKNAFADELKWLQIQRRFAFNSPVQFNAGIFNEYGVPGSQGLGYWRNPDTGEIEKVEYGEYVHPQAHACFIAGPRDDLGSILTHVMDEGSVFSLGSGIGQNIGALRADGESLSGGGKSSGPLSFLKIYDDAAGAIKSAGKSRRAARMTTMRYNHADVMEFIQSKVKEEIKSRVLQENGYSGGMDGEAVRTVTFQNTNFSVRLDDHFFEQLEKDGEVELKYVKSGGVSGKVSARRMLQEIAFGSWRIGDPAVQYESKIQEYHTAKNSGRQNSTNPCSEYMFLDDTSCNLNSHNIVRYTDAQGNLDVAALKRGFWLTSIAADILNDAASYPIKNVAMLSPEFRTIGVGYAGLGSLLMRRGLAYDSEEGRALAAGITALMTGTVYEASADMAEKLGPFVHFEFNREPMLEVMEKHKRNLEDVLWEHVPNDLREAAYKSWEKVIERGKEVGFRNAQATVIAPTGTIAFLMGCQDSTGLEPGYSLTAKKNLAGGGTLTVVNKEVPNSLRNLGYDEEQSKAIEDYISEKNMVIGAPHMNPDHYGVFATAVGNEKEEGTIPFEGHVRMLGAVQPFISGSMSKTSNLPSTATVKEIYDGYLLGKKLNLKALAVFRKDSKTTSALGNNRDFKKLKRGEKEDLPSSRAAHEWEFGIGGTNMHIIVSEYQDGRPGQISFLSYKAGSTLGSHLSTAGVQASRDLKRGVKLEDIAQGWLGHEMEPRGLVFGHPYIKTATSPFDFAARLLLLEYMGRTEFAEGELRDKIKTEELRGFQNGAFRTYERMDFDDWNIEQVLADSEFGGFSGTKSGLAVKSPKQNKNGNNERGVLCGKCGNLMNQTAPGCFKCGNCGDSIGGCGI